VQALLLKLKKDLPNLTFEPGETFSWSPKRNTVVFKTTSSKDEVPVWSLLHEVGHGFLGHSSYESDFHLLQMEMQAWEKAKELGNKYNHQIEEDHIQDCLDTYRDWLYKRSSCPECLSCSLQTDNRTYRCFNCGASWRVSLSRLCRSYRLKTKEASI
jgi:hypothetical protein